jgi:hypothetical protein
VPSTVFTKPSGLSNIVRHITAVTTVSTAHGISTTVRRRPWPLNAACMHIAMPRPMKSSSVTEETAKIMVCANAAHQSASPRAVE